jgi:hypothetical protein
MCGERLRFRARNPRLVLLGAIAAAGLACFAMGARGPTLFIGTLFLYVPIYFLTAFVEGAFFPRLMIDRPKYGDVDFHITGDR